jgi:hypothetical protein
MWHKRGGGGEHTGFWRGNRSERNSLQNVDAGGKMTLNSIFKKLYRGMDWIDLAQDRERWLAC